jgi:hypothetical protein
MNQTEIKEACAALDAEAQKMRLELDLISVRKKYWQRLCSHTDGYTYYAMGERGFKCPDCGYQT